MLLFIQGLISRYMQEGIINYVKSEGTDINYRHSITRGGMRKKIPRVSQNGV